MHSYENFRSKIKSGDIVVFSRTGIVRFFTTSEYSHVGMVWKCNGRLFLLESVEPYIRAVPLSNFAKEGFYVLSMKEAMSKAETDFALSKIGSGHYSKLQAIAAYFKKLKIGEDNLWQCCEFVITCRKLSGVDLGDVAIPSALVQTALSKGYELTYIKD